MATTKNQKPLLFISHKHTDKAIGARLAEFVRNLTGGGVDVFLSSDSGFEGPRLGKELNAELKQALWRAGVVMLVYTSRDKDWSWCTWECGVAEDPQSPATKVLVFQCLEDPQEIYAGSLCVVAWEATSVENFARRFLDEDFFPGLGSAVTGLKEAELIKLARALHADLQELIPREPVENWAAWPFLRIQLDKEVLEQLAEAPKGERLAKTRGALVEKGVVMASASGSAQLFGLAELPPGMPFGKVVEEWSEHYPHRPAHWVDVIARQIIDGARRSRPTMESWQRFRQVEGNAEFVCGVGRIKSDPVAMQFDTYFLRVSRVPAVVDRMTRLDMMYHLDLATKPAVEIQIKELLGSLEERGWNRVPVLEDKRPKYIVHVSMIDRFLRKKGYDGEETTSLTLADLLADEAMEEVFAETWEVEDESATLAEAHAALRAKPGCEDVFVTENGGRDELVLGWLTDKDIADLLN